MENVAQKSEKSITGTSWIYEKALFPIKVVTWGGEKALFRKGPFSPPQTPPLFSKPFPGIYLFALQIDKCHSSF